MNNLTKDFIAIDTNVFEHLFNPQENRCRHIDKLLGQLVKDKIKLLVDNKKRITNEYGNRIRQRIRQIKDHSGRRLLIKYWMEPNNHTPSQVDSNDTLMKKIKMIVTQTPDSIFVYVALNNGRVLITNDRKDIIDEHTRDNNRRQKLLEISKKGADILTSEEAHDRITS